MGTQKTCPQHCVRQKPCVHVAVSVAERKCNGQVPGGRSLRNDTPQVLFGGPSLHADARTLGADGRNDARPSDAQHGVEPQQRPPRSRDRSRQA